MGYTSHANKTSLLFCLFIFLSFSLLAAPTESEPNTGESLPKASKEPSEEANDFFDQISESQKLEGEVAEAAQAKLIESVLEHVGDDPEKAIALMEEMGTSSHQMWTPKKSWRVLSMLADRHGLKKIELNLPTAPVRKPIGW